MPYPKMKTENYQNFGGINTKVSPYAQTPQEFLDISNMDFQAPGALSKRQGSTQYLTAGTSGRITGLYEFESLTGASYIMAGANTSLYYIQAHALNPVTTALQVDSLMDFTTFVDRLFFANGANFMKWKAGATAYLFSLPAPTLALSATWFGNSAIQNWASSTLTYSVGWINDRGFHGMASAPLTIKTSGNSGPVTSIYLLQGITNISGGGTYAYFQIEGSASYGLGYTVMGVTVYSNGATAAVGTTDFFAGIALYRDSGPGTQRFRVGYDPILTTNGVTLIRQQLTFIRDAAFDDSPNRPLSTFPEPSYMWFTLAPRNLEIYQNQLFMSGFSQSPSVVYFSDPGEPEGIEPTYNFEVRTNDGDRVTGTKSYQNQLIVFKERSVHSLTGDNIDNFILREITDQYGCISGRAVAVWENYLWFLDKKGICEYNGANTKIVSNKVEPFFTNMNISAARDNAVMIHNKHRNEVWCGIPTNGSTVNNTTIVYDYLSNAWTKFEGFNPSSMAVGIADFSQPSAVYGSYSGGVFNFGSSYFGDNGIGMTALAKSRFMADEGESTQKQFRRLWVNTEPVIGSTSYLQVNLLQDFGSSLVVSTTLIQNPFQNRIEFGISAKSLAVQISNFSATDSVRLHGFSVAHRFQREV